MRAKLGLTLAAIAVLLPLRAMGNDSEAELATGGLVFKKNPFIEMRSEELFISMEEIRVLYTFFNRSNTDVTTTVAFPMPDMTMSEDYQVQEIPSNDPEKPLDFETIAAGKKVSTSVDWKVYAKGVDQTAVLRRLGVPLAPHRFAKDALALSEVRRLKDLGLLNDRGDPRWTLKTTFFWKQTFPARKDLVIEHNYKPSVGGTVPLPITNLIDVFTSRYYRQYCIDKQFLTAVTEPANKMWAQHYLKYILVTGANWSGPIRNFRLVVDKGSPDNLVSFCGQGVRKISPTQFEVRATRFVPTGNLSVLILTPERGEAADDWPTGGDREVNDLYALNCDQLWYQRNSIFKAAAYCFHTARGIRVFGNAGCRYEKEFDVPLSDRDRQTLKLIQQVGRVKSCQR